MRLHCHSTTSTGKIKASLITICQENKAKLSEGSLPFFLWEMDRCIASLSKPFCVCIQRMIITVIMTTMTSIRAFPTIKWYNKETNATQEFHLEQILTRSHGTNTWLYWSWLDQFKVLRLAQVGPGTLMLWMRFANLLVIWLTLADPESPQPLWLISLI